MSNVKLVWVTPDAEKLIAYIARVSSTNQENPEYEGLLKYLIKNKHWSPFEMVSACFEIETSRAIGRQILRHRSFSYQEFSQRYSNFNAFMFSPARKQGVKNRQGSDGIADQETRTWWEDQWAEATEHAQQVYVEALQRGIAKEVARFVLPEATVSKMYMAGTLRSWIHYLDLRTSEHTQEEHRDIALAIREQLKPLFPTIGKVLEW